MAYLAFFVWILTTKSLRLPSIGQEAPRKGTEYTIPPQWNVKQRGGPFYQGSKWKETEDGVFGSLKKKTPWTIEIFEPKVREIWVWWVFRISRWVIFGLQPSI